MKTSVLAAAIAVTAFTAPTLADFFIVICRRKFSSHSSLNSHMSEHTGPRQCKNCGRQLRENEYHRC